jgi:hypothetical protein
MNLLQKIQDATVDPKYQLADILRMCKILASRLDHQAFKEWIAQELNGYENQEQLPDYRILRDLGCRGDFMGAFSDLKNAPIPPISLPEEFRDSVSAKHVVEGASSLESIASQAKQSNRSILKSFWDADNVILLGLDIYGGMVCGQAWTEIPTAALVAILDTIKTRILDFVIEIQAENPNAGDALPHEKLIPDQIVNNIYYKCILHENQMTENYTNNLQGANVANMANTVKDNARQQANQHIHLSEEKRTLAEAANTGWQK